MPSKWQLFGAPDSSSTARFSIKAFSTKALPVTRWHCRQWQAWTIMGSAVSR